MGNCNKSRQLLAGWWGQQPDLVKALATEVVYDHVTQPGINDFALQVHLDLRVLARPITAARIGFRLPDAIAFDESRCDWMRTQKTLLVAHKSQTDGLNSRLRAIADIELLEQAAHLVLHIAAGHTQVIRDFPVGPAACNQTQDLPLARGQLTLNDDRFDLLPVCRM